MSGDYINTKLITVVVQENGIIRDCDGLFLARLDRDISFASLTPTQEAADRISELERQLETDSMKHADALLWASDHITELENKLACRDSTIEAMKAEMVDMQKYFLSLERQIAERGEPVGYVTLSPTQHRNQHSGYFHEFESDTRIPVGAELFLHPQIPAGWQPIETCPEKETVLFLLDGGEMQIGKMERAVYRLGGFKKDLFWGWFGVDDNCPPTHWMPLPAAPQIEVKP